MNRLTRRLLLSVAALVALTPLSAQAGAFDDNAAGTWSAGGTWTVSGVDAGSDGKPSPNDHILKDDVLTVTVTADEGFGNATNESKWDEGVITINPGCTLTHDDPDPGEVSTWRWRDNRSAALNGGGTFVNRDRFWLLSPAAGNTLDQNGGTTTENEGTVILETGTTTYDRMDWSLTGGSDIFRNRGTLILRTRYTQWGTLARVTGDGALYNEGGTIQVDIGTAVPAASGLSSYIETATFNNDNGTIRVESGALVINSADSQLSGVSVGTTLTTGSYIVTDPDGTNVITPTLDWNGNVGPGKFETLGSNALVTLSGPDARFDAVNALDAVAGVFSLRNGIQFTNTPAGGTFTVAETGVLEFGLNAPDSIDPATTTNALLTVNGTVSLPGSTRIRVLDSGGVSQDRYVIIAADTLDVPAPRSITVEFSGEMPERINKGKLDTVDNNLVLTLRYQPPGTVIRVL